MPTNTTNVQRSTRPLRNFLQPRHTKTAAATVLASAHALQIHSHTHTCAKGSHAADDENCRMAFPRPLCATTTIDLRSCITQRRNHPMLVPFNPSLLLAQPCNHALYAFAEISRFQRDLQLFRDKQQQPGGTQAEPPVLPTLEQAACDHAEYASKYATKADSPQTNAPFLRATLSIAPQPSDTTSLPTATASPPLTPALQGRHFLRRLLNRTHAATTYPAVLAALYLLGHGDSITTFVTAYHPYHAHQQRLTPSATQPPQEQQQEQQLEHAQHCQEADGSLRIVQAQDDYKFRIGLQAYSPFLVTALFEKVNRKR